MVDLGDRVLGPAPRAEAVASTAGSPPRRSARAPASARPARPGRATVGMPSRRSLPAGLGDHPSPAPAAGRTVRPSARPAARRGTLLAPRTTSMERAVDAVDPGGACTPVAPHPVPRHDQERRVIDEVEQVIEPTTRIGGRPLVQLRLHPQYPRPASSRLGHGAPVFTGDLLAFQSVGCELAAPLRHVAGFPGLGLLRRLRPTPAASADDGPCPPPTWLAGRRGQPPGWFPRSPRTVRRGRRPAMPLQPRHGYAADLHRGLPAGDIPGPTGVPTATCSRSGARC